MVKSKAGPALTGGRRGAVLHWGLLSFGAGIFSERKRLMTSQHHIINWIPTNIFLSRKLFAVEIYQDIGFENKNHFKTSEYPVYCPIGRTQQLASLQILSDVWNCPDITILNSLLFCLYFSHFWLIKSDCPNFMIVWVSWMKCPLPQAFLWAP